ncbi:hypothetical protein ACSBR1_023997 [Camellia fascicularis]
MIGHSAISNSILDRAIDSEDSQHKDFLRLEHVEGYHELSAKTKIFFSTAVAKWDANFYVKVDDDVHVNLLLSLPWLCGKLGAFLLFWNVCLHLLLLLQHLLFESLQLVLG